MGEPPRNPSSKNDWLVNIETELKKTSPISRRWSICRVPIRLRSVNEDAYTPHAVSIGPFHSEDKNLKPMEDYKLNFLRFLFQRTEKPEQEILEECYNAILALEEKVRACYKEPIEVDKYKLAKILLYDAGFVLELFFKFAEGCSVRECNPMRIPSWMWVILKRDLALLENQIPLLVLNSLFNIIESHVCVAELPTVEVLALRFFFRETLNISAETLFSEKRRKKANHLLQLLHNYYLPSEPINSTGNEGEKEHIPCATSLRQFGVKFQKNQKKNLFDIKFEDGTLKIPPLYIDDNTDSLFRNLVAFEQCQHSQEYVTSYFTFMDRLIDTTKDVELLQRKKIIRSDLGGGDDVTTLFNNFGKQVVYHEFYYAGLCNEVNAHVNSRWHRNIAVLKRDYFKNPWSITSFVAAAILLLLTVLQTIYTVSSYYRR